MADDFGKEVRELWTQGETADRDNRKEALVDLEFAAGEQWDDRVRQYRESGDRPFPLPCLTINTLPQFIGQVVGDRRANQTSIKVLPRENGDKKVADVRSELIRSIELQSKAERIYTQSFEQAVTCGMGNFRIDLDYAYEDAFERDLFIRGIPNPLAVMWDPLAGDPTAKDAAWCFVTDRITRDEYKRRFPKATDPSGFDAEVGAAGWTEDDTVRAAEYWKIEERERTIALFDDGKVVDVTDRKDDYNGLLFKGPDGQPRIRKSKCKYAVMVMTNGQEALTDPFELKLPRLPIIRVMGREVWVGDRRVRFGLTRFARDPQRLKNYARSVRAELLMGAPRANYIASASAIKGRTLDWANTLVFNDGAPEPREITGVNLSALMNEAEMSAQDMKDTTGLHDASLGARSNETSGIAIQRRQNEGDIATIGYHDNMNAAMQEGGEVLNALLDVVYDTARTARLMGEDGAATMQRLNDPNDPDSIDLSIGRYDTTISTSQTWATKRQEAAAGMIEFARSSPDVVARAGDLIAKAQDWPMADEFAERLKPPGVDDEDDDEELTQEQAEAKAQAMQMQQMVQQMEMEGAQADLALKQAEVGLKQAQAAKAGAEAQAAQGKAEGELELANGQMQIDGAKLALEAEKLKIEGFKAETERMALVEQQQSDFEGGERDAADANDTAANGQRQDAMQAANIEALTMIAEALGEIGRPKRKIPVRDENGFIVSVEEVAA